MRVNGGWGDAIFGGSVQLGRAENDGTLVDVYPICEYITYLRISLSNRLALMHRCSTDPTEGIENRIRDRTCGYSLAQEHKEDKKRLGRRTMTWQSSSRIYSLFGTEIGGVCMRPVQKN